MANANNDVDIVTEILAEMGDSQTSSTLSPIKPPQKRTLSDSDEDIIPSSQQAPKRQKAEGFNQLRNRIASLETRRAKSLRSLKRICRQKLLSSWSPVPATAPSKTRRTIHRGLQQDLPEGGTRSPPTSDPPAAKKFQHRS